jgi:hypothetical protein
MRYWVQGNDTKPYGPYDAETIRTLIAEGRLSQNSPACPEGESQWTTVGSALKMPAMPPLPPASVPSPPMSPLVVAAWILGPLSLGCALLTGIPAIICAAMAMSQPAQKSRALPALITAIACMVIGLIVGIAMWS